MPKDFELHFNEIFQVKNLFIVPLKEIRLNNIHYNPFDQFAGTIRLLNISILQLRNKIITGTVINNVYTILGLK